MPVSVLSAVNQQVLDALKERRIGKIETKQSIHFCGMIHLSSGETAIFLPRGVQGDVREAKLLMTTLAKYGKASARAFEADGLDGSTGLLSVIKIIADDFIANGLFRERERVRSRNYGTPDWKRTFSRGTALVDVKGGVVFENVFTTRTLDNSDNLISQIQAAVLSEIISSHSWWVDGLSGRAPELRAARYPSAPRTIWPLQLDALLSQLYSSRSILLANCLAYYIRNSRRTSAGHFVFGVEDFHWVWEAMLREVLMGVEAGWNERLPRAFYHRDGSSNVGLMDRSRSMRTDIVLREEGGYVIVDAKYYDAISEGSVPGWPDIAKQMIYEISLRSVVGPDIGVKSVFVFPGDPIRRGNFKKVVMLSSSGEGPLKEFPTIDCRYIPFEELSTHYINSSKYKLV